MTEEKQNKKFITTTLPYINSTPHVGHAFEFVLADVLVRYWKAKNKDVLFNVGVDEHGQKVLQAAQAAGLEPQVFCDQMSDKWKEFCQKFQIKWDNFYRTTDKVHQDRVTEYFERIKNFYYQKDYTGLYCQGCEAFKTEKEIIDGKCIDHPTIELQQLSEKNYFLHLKELIANKIPEDILINDWLKNELNNYISNADDISISRETVTWGIPFPNDSTQTIYVWAEALSNYFFAAGYIPNKELSEEFISYWSNSLIICGPDNLRFQAMILPALLIAGGISPSHKVMVHGSIQDAEGKKMSKTTGNVIDPIDQLEKYGLNPVRYYLVAGLNTYGNSKYIEKDLIDKWNNDIVKGYGNLMARVLHLIDIKNSEIHDRNILYGDKYYIDEQNKLIHESFEKGNLKLAYELVAGLVSYGDKFISSTKPYDDKLQFQNQKLNTLYYLIKIIQPYYQFVFPEMIDEISNAIKNKKKVILFKTIEPKDVTETV